MKNKFNSKNKNNSVIKNFNKELSKKDKESEMIDITKELVEKGYSIEEISSILDISCSLLSS